MDKKLPTWLLILLALVPLLLLAALLISLASSHSAKNQKTTPESDMVIYYFDQQKPDEETIPKGELIESQESRLHQQRALEFSQISQSTQSQLDDLKTQRDLSRMKKSF